MNWQLKHPELPHKKAALTTATGWGRSKHTVENIIRGEKSWIITRTIVSSLRGKHAKSQSMLNDEGTIIAMCEYIDKAIESMYSI